MISTVIIYNLKLEKKKTRRLATKSAVMKKVLFAILLLSVIAIQAKSQSAVYFDGSNGAAGWAYGMSSQAEAEDSAYDRYLRHDGTHPRLIASTDSRGYGTIAVGTDLDGNRAIGVALAEVSEDLAKDQAKYECENV